MTGGNSGSVGTYIQTLAEQGKVKLGKDGKTPVAPDELEINGASVVDTTHEYVVKRPNAQN